MVKLSAHWSLIGFPCKASIEYTGRAMCALLQRSLLFQYNWVGMGREGACMFIFLRKVQIKSIKRASQTPKHFEARKGNWNHIYDSPSGIINEILSPNPFVEDFFMPPPPKKKNNAKPHRPVNNDRTLMECAPRCFHHISMKRINKQFLLDLQNVLDQCFPIDSPDHWSYKQE